MKKLIAFDLDGTLAPSKSKIPDQMGVLLNALLSKFQVCIISGGKYDIFEQNVLSNTKLDKFRLKNLHLMPTCGTKYYTYSNNKWSKVYAENLNKEEKHKIKQFLIQALDDLNLRESKIYGKLIDDRESQLTISFLGQDIVQELGEKGLAIKERWDKNNKKKELFRAYVAPRLSEFEVRVGGLTSIDVTKPGIDKAYGMKKLMEHLKLNKKDILFIGDRLMKGGNDYPVKAFGIDSLEIGSWNETAVAIQAILYTL